MPTTAILDTNLLLLFVVGTTNLSYIEKHKRLKSFSVEDFELLLRAISGADAILLYPNTLTETSNLVFRPRNIITKGMILRRSPNRSALAWPRSADPSNRLICPRTSVIN